MRKLLVAVLVLLSLSVKADTLDPEVPMKQSIIEFVSEVYKVSNAETIVNYVFEVSKRKSLDPTFVLGMIATESSFKTHAKSPAQALGLLQVHYPSHKAKMEKLADMFEIEKNLELGTDIWVACKDKSKTLSIAAKCYSGGHRNWLANVNRNQNKINTFIKVNYARNHWVDYWY